MPVLYGELRQPLELDFNNFLSPNKIALFPSAGQEGYATNFVDSVNKTNAIYTANLTEVPPYFNTIDTANNGSVTDIDTSIDNGLFVMRCSSFYHTTRHYIFKSADYSNNHRFYIELHDDGIQYRFGNNSQTSTQAFSSPTDKTNVLTIAVRWVKNGGTYEFECIVYDTDFAVLSTFNTTTTSAPFTGLAAKNGFYRVGKLYGLYLSEGAYTATDALSVATNLYSVFQPDILEEPAIVINSVIGEQIEQGELSQVKEHHSLLNVDAEQYEEASPVTLVSKASIASINAEQIEQGQANQVTANLSLPSLDAEQCEEASPVTLVSKASIASINAEQIEQGQVNLVTIKYSLSSINAEQIEQAPPVTLASQALVTHVSAEQIEQASTVSLGGANLIVSLLGEQIEQGDINSFIVNHLLSTLHGEQVEQGEISPIMANHSLLSLSAQQLEQVVPATLTSALSIDSVIAEQIEQGTLIEQQIILDQSLLRSNQVSLIKTTFHYKLMKSSSTLTTIKTTPTYSIQKV